MNPLIADPKRLRSLVRSQDPTDWLIAADMLEDAGDARSSIYRARGRWWPVLHPAMLRCADARPSGRTAVEFHLSIRVGEFQVTFTRKPFTMLVRVYRVVHHGQHAFGYLFAGSISYVPLLRGDGTPWACYWKLEASRSPISHRIRTLEKSLRGLIDFLAMA